MTPIVVPSPVELEALREQTSHFITALRNALKQHNLPATLFIGGSFAKGTLVRKEVYDVDIFVRTKECTPAFGTMLEKVLHTLHPKTLRVHGSRDYFQVPLARHLVFDIVPVTSITRPDQMENVTDLSYFHVRYVTKKLTAGKAKEVILAKAFCQSAGVYGAESYINGFSGYCLECLIIHYGSLRHMLRALAKAKTQLVLDPARHYRSRGELIREVSEAKRLGPLVLVDPTWPARNVAAGLSQESFEIFQQRARAYLAHPSERFFVEQPFDAEMLTREAKKKSGHLLVITLETLKQAGDIAGTKLKKFHSFIAQHLAERFTVIKQVFRYAGKQESTSYFILTEKHVIQQGPLLSMTKHAQAFKKAHPTAKMAKGRYYVTLPLLTPERYLQHRISEQTRKEMDIMRMKVD